MRPSLLLPAALALAGCGGAPADNAVTARNATAAASALPANVTPAADAPANATVAPPAAAVATTTVSRQEPSAASLGIRPGKWENRLEVLEMQVSTEGLPPQLAEAMKRGMNRRPPPEVATTCLTPEQAAKGPSAAMLANAHCTFRKADYGGGRIDTDVTCQMPNGTLTSKGTGSYSPTSYTVEARGGMTGQMKLKMHTRTTGRWLGQCDGEAKK